MEFHFSDQKYFVLKTEYQVSKTLRALKIFNFFCFKFNQNLIDNYYASISFINGKILHFEDKYIDNNQLIMNNNGVDSGPNYNFKFIMKLRWN